LAAVTACFVDHVAIFADEFPANILELALTRKTDWRYLLTAAYVPGDVRAVLAAVSAAHPD
jgi:hypothetical protein